MVERIKSVVLTILILTSLLLSGLLWYKSPNAEEINRNDYIPQQLIGESRQLEQLVQPRSLIYHKGNGRHLMSFSGDKVYDRVTKALSDGQLMQMKEKTLTPKEWDHLLKQVVGWELRFPAVVPLEVLSERLYNGIEKPENMLSIDRIWVYRHQNDLKLLLISDLENRVYEGQFVANGDTEAFGPVNEPGLLAVTAVTEKTISANPYEPIRVSMSYFPDRVLSMSEWKAPLKNIDLEQMKNLLFLDPSLVRTMTDAEEGTVMMQDGSRSVRYVEGPNMLYYQNYKMKLDSKPIEADLNEAVTFINQHGGWMDHHQLIKADSSEGENNANRYAFRLVKNGLSVYDNGNKDRYGTLMTVESKGGHVLRYDRSLHFTAEDEFVKQSTVPGGRDALDELRREINMADVRDMFPAYRVTRDKKEDTLRYIPGWRIQFTNGEEAWFEGLKDEGGKADGLE